MQQKLFLNIEEMTCHELKKELQQNQLQTCGRKAVLAQRFREYLISGWKTVWLEDVWLEAEPDNSEQLSIGYCRRSEKRYNLNIPVYLKQIVHQYAEPGTDHVCVHLLHFEPLEVV